MREKEKIKEEGKMKRIRRDKIKRLIEKGKIEARCKYQYTDDYAYDNANNFGKTEWLPTRISSGYEDKKEGYINFEEHDFRYKSGAAWENDDRTITFMVLSNHSFALRIR